MRKPLRLAIIHRHRLFRECLRSVLSDVDRFDVMEVDYTASDYLKTLDEKRPEVVVIDLNLPGQLAIELTRRVRERLDCARVIVLGCADTEESLFEIIEAGAHGCVLDQSSVEDLQNAIDRVIRGETFCSPQIVHMIFQRLAESGRESHWRQRLDSVVLTRRELEVLRLVAELLSNKEIAKRLSLSLCTVKNHVHNIVEKLQVEGRFEAVDHARQRGWLKKSGTSEAPGQDG